jgi:hypothetical protein
MGQQSLNGRESRTRAGQCAVLEPGVRLVSTGRTGKLAPLLVPAMFTELGREMPACSALPATLGPALPRGRCQRRSPTSPRSVAGVHPRPLQAPSSRSHMAARGGPAARGWLSRLGWGPAPQAGGGGTGNQAAGPGPASGVARPLPGPLGIGWPWACPGDSEAKRTTARSPWRWSGALTSLTGRNLESAPCTAARRTQAGSRWATSTARAACVQALVCGCMRRVRRRPVMCDVTARR